MNNESISSTFQVSSPPSSIIPTLLLCTILNNKFYTTIPDKKPYNENLTGIEQECYISIDFENVFNSSWPSKWFKMDLDSTSTGYNLCVFNLSLLEDVYTTKEHSHSFYYKSMLVSYNRIYYVTSWKFFNDKETVCNIFSASNPFMILSLLFAVLTMLAIGILLFRKMQIKGILLFCHGNLQ